jgi:hypothetical protein
LKPYRHSGFQILGEKIKNRFAKADRLEAGGLSPLSGKSKNEPTLTDKPGSFSQTPKTKQTSLYQLDI